MTEPSGSTAQGNSPEKIAPAPKTSPQQKDKPTPAPESRAQTTKTSKKRRKVNHGMVLLLCSPKIQVAPLTAASMHLL